jgi:hypothetical protein
VCAPRFAQFRPYRVGNLPFRAKRSRIDKPDQGRGAVRNVLMAVLLAMAVATPVCAQSLGGGQDGFKPNMAGEGMKRKTVEDWQAEQDREKAYKSGMSKIPDQKVKNDPWGTVRPPAK